MSAGVFQILQHISPHMRAMNEAEMGEIIERVRVLISRIQSNDPKLREVYLDVDSELTEEDYFLICEALKQNNVVHTLTFDRLDKDFVIALIEMLKYNETIHTLRLESNYIGDDAVTALAEALEKSTSVRSLFLDLNIIGNAGATALGNMLKKNNILRLLWLGVNDINAACAVALSGALKENNALCDLYLGRMVGDREKLMFIDALRYNITLQRLAFDPAFDPSYMGREMQHYFDRNKHLKWSNIDRRLQSIVVGLDHSVLGCDVYTILLIIDCLPHCKLLNRPRKVALLQSLIK